MQVRAGKFYSELRQLRSKYPVAMSPASALPENWPTARVAGTTPALAQLAVVDRQPGLRCHLDHDLLVRLAARHDPRHILLGASIAQIPAGHRALVGMARRA